MESNKNLFVILGILDQNTFKISIDKIEITKETTKTFKIEGNNSSASEYRSIIYKEECNKIVTPRFGSICSHKNISFKAFVTEDRLEDLQKEILDKIKEKFLEIQSEFVQMSSQILILSKNSTEFKVPQLIYNNYNGKD